MAQRKDANMAAAGGRPSATDHGAAVTRWWTSTFAQAMFSGLWLWSAFPPLRWWPLAWLAPVFWIRLIGRQELGGRRPYGAIYLAGFLHWLLLIQWVRLPHWSAYFGWLALAWLMGFYLPVFIGLTRVAVRQLHLPLVMAAPAVWTGLELLRGHFLTGFSLALLGHTQDRWLTLIQIADLWGAYGVSFVVMLVAACLEQAAPCQGRRWAWKPLMIVPVVLAGVLAYGHWRLATGPTADPDGPVVRVALIQGAIDTQFGDGDRRADPVEPSFAQYRQLTLQAVARHGDLDLVVWPESMFTGDLPWVTADGELQPGPDLDLSVDELRRRVALQQFACQWKARQIVQHTNGLLLAGTEAWHFAGASFDRFNSALLLDQTGTAIARYDKMHPVMFGEYVPLGRWLPWLYHLTPMSGGLTPGRQPASLDVGGLRLSPSICFENTVPHLIRRQVARLASAGQTPDVLVTLTNDGWFWGSSLLDLHLTCGRFRAVEMRLPTLIAANTGFSAWIDGSGRIRGQGPRRDKAVLLATVARDGRHSLYLAWGDWGAGICLAVCLVSAVGGGWRAVRRRFVGPASGAGPA